MKRGPLPVTAALIRRGDEILVARRKADSKVEAGKWEFPGGKFEFGESPEECLAREIREELGVEIEVGRLHGISSWVYADIEMHVLILCYECRLLSGEPRALDVGDWRWVRAEELTGLEFAAADVPLLSRIK